MSKKSNLCCPSCYKPYDQHDGLVKTCYKSEKLAEALEKLADDQKWSCGEYKGIEEDEKYYNMTVKEIATEALREYRGEK